MDEPDSAQLGHVSVNVTQDRLLDGRVTLLQPADGYRAGMDAALLAAACDAADGARVLDVACGAGAVLLAVAERRPGVRLTGVERDADAVDLARRNIAANGLQDRAEAALGDVAAGFAALGLQPFDAALCNPPFFDDPSALRGPAPARKGAWLAEDGLDVWIAFLLKSVREGGAITVVHRADRLADILATLAPKAGSFQVRPIHPYADQAAKRVLVRAVKTGKAPLRLLPPLVLHDRSGAKHTSETEAILRGEEALGWG